MRPAKWFGMYSSLIMSLVGKKKRTDNKALPSFTYSDFEMVAGEGLFSKPEGKRDCKIEKSQLQKYFLFKVFRWNRYGTVIAGLRALMRTTPLGLHNVLQSLHNAYVEPKEYFENRYHAAPSGT